MISELLLAGAAVFVVVYSFCAKRREFEVADEVEYSDTMDSEESD